MLLATLALFAVSLGYGVVVPLLPRLAGGQEPLASPTDLSIVYAAYAAAKIACQIPGGVWVDRRGHWRVLVVALAAYAASLVGFLAPLGPAWTTIVRAAEGAATGLIYPAVFARVLLASDGATAGRRLGAVVGVGSSGLLVGPVLGGWLGSERPWLPIVVCAGLGAGVAVLAVADRAIAPTPAPARTARTLRGEVDALIALARDRRFVGGMLPIAFNKATFTAYQGLLPLVGPEVLAVGSRGTALLFFVVGVVFAVAQPAGGALADRFPASLVILTTTPILLGALSALTWTRSYAMFAIIFGVHVFAQSIVFTATMRQAAREHGSETTYGGVFGLLSTLTDTMTVVGPLVFLNVYASVGTRVFAIMAGSGVAFASAWLSLANPLRARAASSARGSGSRETARCASPRSNASPPPP